MNLTEEKLSTGLPNLDQVLQGLMPGDNVVWEVDSIDDYLPVLGPFCSEARRLQRRLIYFRFARHAPLLNSDCGAQIHTLRPEEGFEKFLTEILDVIEKGGAGAYYVFDCLSDLAADWFSDRMLGNFFMITCPYHFELDTMAYFAVLKNQHSAHALKDINNTAQVILEVYRKSNQLFVQPHKVWQRHSPTMYMLHAWEGQQFHPVADSATITDTLAGMPHPWLDFSVHRPGVWMRTFRQAIETLEAMRKGASLGPQGEELFGRLLKMVITREARFQALAENYFTLADLVEIMQRMIGTGLIGGKSLGMLLARAILKKSDRHWADLLEGHDSFFVGSDVFYTYLVQNGCWWLRRRHKDFNVMLENAKQARERLLTGKFPDYIIDQFMEMVEYFGQSPIIVRSSSLLEDNYGNAFSGKYESVFCANQGSPEERLEALLSAVRTVYASAMSEEGLSYRLHHGLLERDEQMALLVQRVSGELHESKFFPQLAGVGFSFNPFVWHEDIDPHAGMLRLVFGLGTRAVNHPDDDYARLLSLNAPNKRLEARPGDLRQYAQRRLDLLDLTANKMVSGDFEVAAQKLPAHVLDLVATRDQAPSSALPGDFSGYLSFDKLLAETEFVSWMRKLVRTLGEAYNYPVDVEFTANFQDDQRFRINLVQCRPFQVKVKGTVGRVQFPATLEADRVLMASQGPIVGHSMASRIERLIYVTPSAYGQLTMQQRYSIARTLGRLTHLDPANNQPILMLAGPGRWGTSMPSLGVPVSFAEINTVSVLCELTVMHEGFAPDISLGTHFFNDLVEMDMLYLAVSPCKDGHTLNETLIRHYPNRLTDLLPSAQPWSEVIHVVDSADLAAQEALFLNVDSMAQRAVFYRELQMPHVSTC